jgi:type II secretory pathway pseudopilin PulG
MNLRPDRAGFSLVELMVTVTILIVVMGAIMIILITSQQSKAGTEAALETQQTGRTVLQFLERDIRSAGYGVDEDAVPAQPAFAYVDSMELILYANLHPHVPNNSTPVSATAPPLAPSPVGTLPYPTDGTVYEPPIKYTTGAEMIRYTLDLNNDGLVDADDQAHAAAGEARRSRNPSDFVLARIVYGDSSGSPPVANNNGAVVEKLGLVLSPGGAVPPLFTVYLGGNPTPWNWADGPIPVASLNSISRVTLRVTTESRRPDVNGNYVRTTLTGEVNSTRNAPLAGFTTYAAQGFVFKDLNLNGVKDAGEPGLPDVLVRLGSAAVDYTAPNGHYALQAVPGQYTLRQVVPEGYGPFTSDTVFVDFVANPVNVTHDFADTAMAGGWILDSAYVDVNANLVREPDEPAQEGVAVTVAGVTRYTDAGGGTSHFVPPGTWDVYAAAPESLVITSTVPVTVSLADGDTVVARFAHSLSGTGTVSGKVWFDTDRDMVVDGSEPKLANIWVGVTKDMGLNVLGFAYTDANGDYSITVPNNLPDATTPYEVTLIVPPAHYPTGPSVLGPIWISDGGSVTNQNFGLHTFQVITLNAERVLSLGSGELMEKDWSGNDSYAQYGSKGRQDRDLVLGSEYSSNPNISVWFNRWNSTPYFDAIPTYQRNAFSSALSLAVGPIDPDAPWHRPDVVTGLESYASGNIAVWTTQGTSGNMGYLPASPTYLSTLDGGHVNAVLLHDVDGDGDNDLIPGSRSYANSGSFEVWTNAGGVFSRAAAFPPSGGCSFLGEVRGLALGDFDGYAPLDLAVVTRVSDGNGKLHLFSGQNVAPYFILVKEISLAGEGNAVEVLDAGADGIDDIFVGTRKNFSQGTLEHWGRPSGLPFEFVEVRKKNASGIVLSLEGGDYGGVGNHPDLAYGFLTAEGGYAGGLEILLLDGGTFPVGGIDPSGGAAPYMVPALNANHFNYGANPAPSGTPLLDLAAAMKSGATTGAVLVFLR